jgi:hypothetical protein
VNSCFNPIQQIANENNKPQKDIPVGSPPGSTNTQKNVLAHIAMVRTLQGHSSACNLFKTSKNSTPANPKGIPQTQCSKKK